MGESKLQYPSTLKQSTTEDIAFWKKMAALFVDLASLSAGLAEIDPRLKRLPKSLGGLAAEVPNIRRATTIEAMAGELHRGLRYIKAVEGALSEARAQMESLVQEAWARKKELSSQ